MSSRCYRVADERRMATMGPTPRPRLLVCYICGREYGSKSLGIHLPQCRKMYEAQEAKKPKSQRRKLPDPPPGYIEAMKNVVLVPSTPRGAGSAAAGASRGEEVIGDAASPFHRGGGDGGGGGGVYEQTVRGGDGGGGDDALRPRVAVNSVSSPSFTADALNDAAYRHWSENVLETCEHCKRTFTPDAMAHHRNACTAAGTFTT